MYNPDRSFGFLLYDAARLIRRDFERRVRAIGLSRTQWAALAHLRRNEGCNQSTLADFLEVEPITLARLLERMESAGWIERRPDPHDRRARLIFLTPKARPVIDEISALAVQSSEVALNGIAPEDREKMIDLLTQVRANLSRSGPTGGVRSDRPRGGGRRAAPRRMEAPLRSVAQVELAVRK